MERNRCTLNRAQRITAIRANRYCSSVSDMVSILLVSIPPVDLVKLNKWKIEIKPAEMFTIKKAKKIARESTIVIWHVM